MTSLINDKFIIFLNSKLSDPLDIITDFDYFLIFRKKEFLSSSSLGKIFKSIKPTVDAF